MVNTILLYLIKIIHLFVMFLVVIGPLFIKNPLLLLLIIVINIFIVTGWYLYGYCFLTDIENSLSRGNLANKEKKKSFITSTIEKYVPFITEKHMHNLLSIVPFLSTLICSFTLYKNYKVSRKLK